MRRWLLLVLLLVAATARATDMTVDRRTISTDDSLTITVTLDDEFYDADVSRLPVQNLVIDQPPSIATTFRWTPSESVRQRVLRFTAHAPNAGGATVGPLVLHGSDGRVMTLPAIAIQVTGTTESALTDPGAILHELLATGRDPVFVVAESDRKQVFAGEEVVVTWTLYNATAVQQYGFGDMPKLDDFWTEELRTHDDQPEQIRLGGIVVQKVAIRRAALFPLRSGTLTIPPLSINAAVMRQMRTDNPFGEFEGTIVEVHRRSGSLTIESRPIPPGPPVAAVGDVTMNCSTPVQRNGGPVVIDVALEGRANLRAVAPPQFETPLDGTLQIVDSRLSVDPNSGDATETRSWRYLIFPARSGFLTIPALSVRTLTAAGERRELRCERRLVEVTRAAAEPAPPPNPSRSVAATVRRAWIPLAIAVALLIAIAFALPRAQRAASVRREVLAIVGESGGVAAALQNAEAWLTAKGIDPAALLREASDRGDAWRALRSLTDDRLDAGARELRSRARDLVIAVSR